MKRVVVGAEVYQRSNLQCILYPKKQPYAYIWVKATNNEQTNQPPTD